MSRGINPAYPPPGEDATLDWMRTMGLPDPGTIEADWWVEDNIEREPPHAVSCSCETCMQEHPERFDEDWDNIYAED